MSFGGGCGACHAVAARCGCYCAHSARYVVLSVQRGAMLLAAGVWMLAPPAVRLAAAGRLIRCQSFSVPRIQISWMGVRGGEGNTMLSKLTGPSCQVLDTLCKPPPPRVSYSAFLGTYGPCLEAEFRTARRACCDATGVSFIEVVQEGSASQVKAQAETVPRGQRGKQCAPWACMRLNTGSAPVPRAA